MTQATAALRRPLRRIAAELNEAHASATAAARSAISHALQAGDLLLEAKAQVRHGGWSDWLAEHFVGSERTAQGYMRLARNRADLPSDPQRVADLPVREALSLLAEPRSIAPSEDADAGVDDDLLDLGREAATSMCVDSLGAFGRALKVALDRPEPLEDADTLAAVRLWNLLHIGILGSFSSDDDAAPRLAALNVTTEMEERATLEALARKQAWLERIDPFGQGSGRGMLGDWDSERCDLIEAMPTATPEQRRDRARARLAYWGLDPGTVDISRPEVRAIYAEADLVDEIEAWQAA